MQTFINPSTKETNSYQFSHNFVITLVLAFILILSSIMLNSCTTADPTQLPDPTVTPRPQQNPHLNTYYVSPTGNDSNPGTEALPFLTIQQAADKTEPGFVVIVEAGTYSQVVNINASGTSSAQILYKANGNVITGNFTIDASYVTIDGFEIALNSSESSGWGVYLTGSYNKIENNYIRDLPWGGILLFADVSNPTQTVNNMVQNNKIYHVGQVGIDIRGRNNTVQYNDISATIQYVPSVLDPPDWVDADGIHFHGQGHTIRGNKIHDISFTQPENKDPHIDCFQTFVAPPTQEAASDILFEGNFCNEPTHGGGLAAKFIQSENAQNLTFINNISYTYLAGLVTGSKNITFLNNTFVALEPDGQGIHLSKDKDTTIENNIFANQSNGVGAIFPDFSSNLSLIAGNNCISNQGGNRLDLGDVLAVDPLFVNPENDFHLLAASPCIDKGLSLANVSIDFDGILRPQGGGYDMGAYEYVVSP